MVFMIWIIKLLLRIINDSLWTKITIKRKQTKNMQYFEWPIVIYKIMCLSFLYEWFMIDCEYQSHSLSLYLNTNITHNHCIHLRQLFVEDKIGLWNMKLNQWNHSEMISHFTFQRIKYLDLNQISIVNWEQEWMLIHLHRIWWSNTITTQYHYHYY